MADVYDKKKNNILFCRQDNVIGQWLAKSDCIGKGQSKVQKQSLSSLWQVTKTLSLSDFHSVLEGSNIRTSETTHTHLIV